VPERRTTRRGALAACLAGAAGLALARAAPAGARGAGEGRALMELIRAEEDAAFVYRSAGLDGATALPEQDGAHARALATHLEALGMQAPDATRGRDDLPPEALALLAAPAGGARLRAAMAYERALIAGCAQRLPALEEPGTVRTVATVMASHAQHLVLHELMSAE
jgi:hypothetical protein